MDYRKAYWFEQPHMEYFAVREIFYQFFPLTGVLPFTWEYPKVCVNLQTDVR